MPEGQKREIEDFISWWMTENKVPGMSIGLVEGDEVVYANGFGSRDLNKDLPTTVKTLYGIGSISKSFTAIAVMKLVQEGKLSVYDLVKDHLPVNWDESITIHHLLTHSSGMPSLGVSEVLIARLIGLEERGVPLGDRADFYMHINNALDEFAAPPGERFFYFNSGYKLLGLIVEKVGGRSYEEYVREEILAPLSMNRSTFVPEGGDVMTPYFSRNNDPTPTELPVRDLSFPAGGLLSSVDEMVNYLMMNMNGGIFKGINIIDEEFLNEIHKGHIPRERGSYGYGWSVKHFNGKKFIGHGGSIAVASAYLGFTDDAGVILACNTSPSSSVEAVGKALLTILDGKDWRELTYFARKERMKFLEGEYETYRGARKAKVERQDGLLRVEFIEELEKESHILIPKAKDVHDYEFYYHDAEGGTNTVEFVVNKGDIDMFVERYRLHKM